MKWHINELLRNHEMYSFDETLELTSVIKQLSPDVREATPFRIVGTGYESEGRYVFQLKISGTLTLPCARSLADVEYPLSFQTIELFSLANNPSDYDEDWDDDLHPIVDGTVDLYPFIAESIVLQIPMKVYKDEIPEDSPAPQKGSDWEIVNQKEKTNSIDPRFASLQNYFNKDTNDTNN
ncbi:YceD family protein [Aureibacillus halotolerans]|uniref:DUF177 domain-containing protein n=1 Tax=Aureibacillus halotolerans TaxID=1508390 RepID=A0A4R6U7I4_9BACI|nr:YceD family protein [Aureibacillus halotolerans]TDQ42311.1 uncharacterized protein EV213_102343 [Aureibacillus halotolerans]